MKYYKKIGTLFETKNSNLVLGLSVDYIHRKITDRRWYKPFVDCLTKYNCKF